MQITIGGPPGSGKGTVGRMLAEHYGLTFVSGGDLFRKAAAERNMSMEEFDIYTREHPEARVDAEIDGLQKRMGLEQDNFVLESRLAWFLVPESFKIKIHCEADECARRIAQVSSDERIAYTQDDLETTKEKTRLRFEAHKAKIREIYGIEDLIADEHFDVVVDSTGIPAREVADILITKIDAHYGN